MAVSRNTGQRQRTDYWKRLFGQLTRYDLVLTAIPAVFVVVLLAQQLLGVPFLAALATGALVSTGLVIDALFLHPPVRRRSGPQ